MSQDTRFRMICNTVFYSSIIGLKFIMNRFRPTMYKSLGWSLVGYFLVDLRGLDLLYIVHHLFAMTSLMVVMGSSLEEVRDIKSVNALIDTEISTIFLNMYMLSKVDVFGYLFFVSFMYFRIIVFSRLMILDYLTHHIDIYSVCKENFVISDMGNCMFFMKGVFYFFMGLNSYWSFFVVKKLVRKLKTLN